MAPPWPAEFRKTRRCKVYFDEFCYLHSQLISALSTLTNTRASRSMACPVHDLMLYVISYTQTIRSGTTLGEEDHTLRCQTRHGRCRCVEGGRGEVRHTCLLYAILPRSHDGCIPQDSSNDRSYRRRSPSSARSSTPPTPHQYRHPSRRDYSRSPGHHSPSPRRDRDGRPPPLSRSADSSDSVRHVAGPSGRDRTNSMASSVRSEPSSGHIPPPPPPIIQESLPTPMTAISLSPTTATSLPISQPPQATGLMHHPPSTLSATAPSEIPTPNPKGLQALSVVIPSSEPANRTGTQKETTAVASAVYAPLSAPFIPASTPAMAISASRSFTFEFAPPGQSTNTVTTNGDHVVTPGDLERADQHVR